MRWPRDEGAPAGSFGYAGPRGGAPTTGRSSCRPVDGPARCPRLALSGTLGNGGTVSLAVAGTSGTYALTGAPGAAPTDLTVPDPSVGRPHARLMLSGQRLGLEDLGSPGAPSSTVPGCFPSMDRATSARCARSASAAWS